MSLVRTRIALLTFLVAAISAANAQNQIFQEIPHPGKLPLLYGSPPTESTPGKVIANNKEFVVFKGVQQPTVQSMFLLEHTRIRPRDVVLDIGTGSGVQAIFAAQKAKRVVATDIDWKAVDNARFNARYHGLASKIDVRESDLFAGIGKDEKFDVITVNIGYPYDQATQGLWDVHERFFAEVKQYLRPDGRIFYESGLIENIPRVQEMVKKNGLQIYEMHMIAALEDQTYPIVFLIKR